MCNIFSAGCLCRGDFDSHWKQYGTDYAYYSLRMKYVAHETAVAWPPALPAGGPFSGPYTPVRKFRGLKTLGAIGILVSTTAAWLHFPETATVPESLATRISSHAMLTLPPPGVTSTEPTLAIDMSGARVTRSGADHVIVFNTPLFTRANKLNDEARIQLARLGRQLESVADRIVIIVAGHTDNEPVPHNREYADNVDLGYLRAEAVVEHLAATAALPRHIFSALGLGERNAPFPNDSEENRARNRTVVITIRPLES
jgi:hypothetical protein